MAIVIEVYLSWQICDWFSPFQSTIKTMNRRKNKSRQQRPLSVIQHCSTSPILRGSCTTRPSSALGTAAPISSVSVEHSTSFAAAWPDTNNNSNCYSSTWNNIEVCLRMGEREKEMCVFVYLFMYGQSQKAKLVKICSTGLEYSDNLTICSQTRWHT